MNDQGNTIVLTDEEGREHEFFVVDVMEVDGEEYAVLISALSAPDTEAEAVILKIGLDDEGNEVLYEIEDKEEWERVAAAWEEAMEGED